MMTQSQKATLHRLARMAVKHNDYGALDAYVTAYAERARSSLDKPVSTDAAAGSGMPATGPNRAAEPRSADRATQPPDTGLRRFLAWLR